MLSTCRNEIFSTTGLTFPEPTKPMNGRSTPRLHLPSNGRLNFPGGFGDTRKVSIRGRSRLPIGRLYSRVLPGFPATGALDRSGLVPAYTMPIELT